MRLAPDDFLSSLTAYDDESVLQALQKRCDAGQFYATIGTETLLAVNPHKPTGLLEDHLLDDINSTEWDDVYPDKPAHIFATALSAYQRMMDNDEHQAILFIGERGSGKTENVKHALRELVHIATQKQPSDLTLIKKVLAANHLLEAFGHCQNTQHRHASHMGKFIEMQYSRDGCLVGAQFHTLLLDQQRLVERPSGEGTFHVLHALVEDAPEEFRAALHLSDGKALFRYLKDTPFDDGVSFSKLERALDELDMTREQQHHLFQCLAALLHLGNVSFHMVEEEEEDDKKGNKKNKKKKQQEKEGEDIHHHKEAQEEEIMEAQQEIENHGSGATPTNKKQDRQPLLYPVDDSVFNRVCSLLQLDAAALLRALTTREDRRRRAKKNRHNSTFTALSIAQAETRRDLLASQLYGFTVSWLCAFVRQRLSSPNFQTVLCLLDLPGFYAADQHPDGLLSFYDYCRNMAHEKLKEFLESTLLIDPKNHFERETLLEKEEEGEEEKGTDSEKKSKKSKSKKKQRQQQCQETPLMHATSNRALLDLLIHGTPVHLTQLLNDASQKVREDPDAAYDAARIAKQIAHAFHGTHPHWHAPPRHSLDEWRIQHALGEARYSGEACVRANGAFLPRTVLEVLRRSEHPLLQQLVNERAVTVQQDNGVLVRLLPHTQVALQRPASFMVGAMAPTDRHLSSPTATTTRDSDRSSLSHLEQQLDQLLDLVSPMHLWQVICVRQQRLPSLLSDLPLSSLCQWMHLSYPRCYDDEQLLVHAHPFLEQWVEAHFDAQHPTEGMEDPQGPPSRRPPIHVMMATLFPTERERALFLLSRLSPSPSAYRLGDHHQLFLSDALHRTLQQRIHTLSRDDQLLRKTHLRRHRHHHLLPSLPDLHGIVHREQGEEGFDLKGEHDALPLQWHHSDKLGYPQGSHGGYLDLRNAPTDSPPCDPPPSPQQQRIRRCWLLYVWLCTWWIPDAVLRCIGRKKDRHTRLAWREKVSLVMIIVLVSALLMFWITGFAGLVCPRPRTHTWAAMRAHTHPDSDAWLGVHGKALDITAFLPVHQGGRKTLIPFLGQDASAFFPRAPIHTLGHRCIANRSAAERAQHALDRDACRVGHYKYCHRQAAQQRVGHPLLRRLTVGDIAFAPYEIRAQRSKRGACFTLGKRVYNVTQYLKEGHLYLPRQVNRVLMNHLGEDASVALRRLPDHAQITHCLDQLFYVGLLTEDYAITCRITDIILLSTVGALVSIMVFKFISALQLSAKRDPEHHDKFVLLMVPCYTEGEGSLRKTIDSLATMAYDDSHKLIVCVADGMVTGSGNDRPTPQLLLELLGADPSVDPPPFAYQALGDGARQLNYAKVYSGIYYCSGHRVPYLVIVKCGRPEERMLDKPGNRGKRDSQLVLLRFLNKMQYDLPMTPLELEVFRHVNDIIGVDPNCYEFLMTVDADTEVKPDALNRMVSCMVHDTKVMALCGETEVSNAKASWVTMIQVYEYYMSHHISKAFESLFGSVTCLPGCFSLYRIRLPGQRLAPCLTLPEIIADYSVNRVDTLHKKNLLHLGEDRYLTTLMLKYFPRMKLSFTADALCRTVVPDKWSVLLSQRRRWINSTLHNLMELLLLKDLCGCCCFSMKFVVLVDMFATMVMPTSVAYMFYLMYVSVQSQQAPLLALIILASMFGLQAILFLMKKQWQHIGWMVIYIFSIPIFHFMIPLYAFWHFDDFSWGQTRKVQMADGTDAVEVVEGGKDDDDEEEDTFDVRVIPVRRLGEVDEAKWALHTHPHLGKQDENDDDDDVDDVSERIDVEMEEKRWQDTMGSGEFHRSGSLISDDDEDVAASLGFAVAPSTMALGGRRIVASKWMTGKPVQNMDNSMEDGALDAGDDVMRSMIREAELDERMVDEDGRVTHHAMLVHIREILSTVDWSLLTKRAIRERLADHFQIDVTEHKAFIDACVDYLIHERNGV